MVPAPPVAAYCEIGVDGLSTWGPSPAVLAPRACEPRALQPVSLIHQLSGLKQQGFSDDVIERLDKVHADSTNKVYLSQWTLFEVWCLRRDINPLTATSVCLCDFFLYLFKERGLRTSTIEGYRSAISFILKRASGYDLSQCELLSDMIKSFRLERPRTARTVVQWDLAIVLSLLQSHQYSLEHASTRELTLRTLFLVALASADQSCARLLETL